MNSGYTQNMRPLRRRRSSLLPLTCGCLATFGVLILIVIAGGILFLPQLIGQVTGLTPQGETEALFEQVIVQPTPMLQNASDPGQITVDLGAFGQQTVSSNPQLYNFTLGTNTGGERVMTAGFTEAGLMQICHERSTICSPNSTDPRFRNARLDLRPGGGIVYVDTTLPQLGNVPLPAGVVLRWDSAAHRAVVEGVDIGGMLYSPASQQVPQALAETVTAIEQQINDLIQQVAVQTSGGRYTLVDVIVDDNNLTIVLR